MLALAAATLLLVQQAAMAPAPAGDEHRTAGRVIIGYVFPRGRVIEPAEIDASKLTHVNYAFANIEKGVVVEGSPFDTENLEALTGLRVKHPHFKVLVSVGAGRGRAASRTRPSRPRAARASSRVPSTSCAATTLTASTWTGNTRACPATATRTARRTRRTSRA